MFDCKKKVVCLQLGSRAHYLIPKSLHEKGLLSLMITDVWVENKLVRLLLAKIPIRLFKALSARYCYEVPNDKVFSLGLPFLGREFLLRFQKKGWEATIFRNKLFQKRSITALPNVGDNIVVFGTSYSSLEVFREAKNRNFKTVLFQIDGGEYDEELINGITKEFGNGASFSLSPKQYWNDWKKECKISDLIMVNSEWSRECLIRKGVDEKKIRIIPLPIELTSKHFQFQRQYPDKFTADRPLRCLFLGSISLRKGIYILLEAAAKLAGRPIEFILVGKSNVYDGALDIPSVRYKGSVTREETELYYKMSDVFLFPTFSDGFGHTQLEAMSWQLPVIASERCGKVVKNGINGWITELESDSLSRLLIQIQESPLLLQICSANCLETARQFDLSVFGDKLAQAIDSV